MKVNILEEEKTIKLKEVTKEIDFNFNDLASIDKEDLIKLIKNGDRFDDLCSFFKCWTNNCCATCELNKETNIKNKTACQLLLEVQETLRS